MDHSEKFFSQAETQQALNRLRERLLSDYTETKAKELVQKLSDFLKIVTSNAVAFDDACRYSIAAHRTRWRDLLTRGATPDPLVIPRLATALHALAVEYDISTPPDGQLPHEVQDFANEMERLAPEFPLDYRERISRYRQDLPFLIVKSAFGLESLNRIKDLDQTSAEIDKRIDGWTSFINDKQDQVQQLGDALSQYKDAYNFVGLAAGFSNLANTKRRQLRWLWLVSVFFGIFIAVPGALELYYFSQNPINISTDWPKALALAIPAISLTLIFIYFFKITQRNADSLRSQILQLDLRRTLCQFIQSYATYAAAIKKENNELLNKFEALIFSGIVTSDEKMPATFDGIEQLTALFKNLSPTTTK